MNRSCPTCIDLGKLCDVCNTLGLGDSSAEAERGTRAHALTEGAVFPRATAAMKAGPRVKLLVSMDPETLRRLETLTRQEGSRSASTTVRRLVEQAVGTDVDPGEEQRALLAFKQERRKAFRINRAMQALKEN